MSKGMDYGNRGSKPQIRAAVFDRMLKDKAHEARIFHDTQMTRKQRLRLRVECASKVTDDKGNRTAAAAPMEWPALPGRDRHRIAWGR